MNEEIYVNYVGLWNYGHQEKLKLSSFKFRGK
jgi:hypothetical protein